MEELTLILYAIEWLPAIIGVASVLAIFWRMMLDLVESFMV